MAAFMGGMGEGVATCYIFGHPPHSFGTEAMELDLRIIECYSKSAHASSFFLSLLPRLSLPAQLVVCSLQICGTTRSITLSLARHIPSPLRLTHSVSSHLYQNQLGIVCEADLCRLGSGFGFGFCPEALVVETMVVEILVVASSKE